MLSARAIASGSTFPGEGYVGVGEVTRPVVRVDEFIVQGPDGQRDSDFSSATDGNGIIESVKTAEVPEHLVGVRWVASVTKEQGNKGKGALRQSEHRRASSRPQMGVHTVERPRERFGLPGILNSGQG